MDYKCQRLYKFSMTNQMGLFENDEEAPLAFSIRPNNIEDFFGQHDLIAKLKSIDINKLPHLIFYGPPGTGKTTLVAILAKQSERKLYPFNAVLSGVAELRELITRAKADKQMGKKSIIFIDEIHRFNKAQQDALLPHLEEGNFVFFGATTEAPQVTLNKAILSRVKLFKLNKLHEKDIVAIIHRALKIKAKSIPENTIDFLAAYSDGDARSALGNLELILDNIEQVDFSNSKSLQDFLNIHKSYDKSSERHYDVISAFIKSVRGSDVDSALLWLAVMIDGGEDIEFIARRLIILASEDIGNADPRGLQIATSCHYAIKTIGMPEARIIIAQATTYLANAPKSNASYLAIDKALEYVRNNPTVEVPTHLRNHHPDKKKYRYPHSYPRHWTQQNYSHVDESFFESSNIGYERMQNETIEKMKNIHD